ncbi:hypothetical protein ACWGH4_00335 [Streptomyces sp. NPDC054847]
MTTPPSLGDAPRHVRIASDGTRPALHIDDTEFTNLVHGYSLQQQAGQSPLLVLHVNLHRQAMEFDGMAHVVVGDQPDPAQAVADFVRSLDPKTLEQAALNRDAMDDGRYGLTRAMLAQIADWALGNGGR